MNTADTIAAVEDATTTERSRLGSDKALIAATDATLERDAVLRAADTRDALAALDESERERARDAAVAAVEAAYEAYADTLETMGLDPKPVC